MMIPDFAALCLMLFVVIDDDYRALPAALKPRGEQAMCSDSELLTMLVVGECMGWHRDLPPSPSVPASIGVAVP